ncbi:MAG TPA: lamin tail domain-containing protein [Flavobacteriales bacterium]|nr:lamin tail domain-containing protein [Flavobacteriales bacterium]
MKHILFAAILFGTTVVKAQGPGACTDIFISEYVEGTSNNKGLELYNPTAAPINLSGYSLKIYFNGSTTAGATFTPMGTIGVGQTFTIAHSSATIFTSPDTTLGGVSVVSFNGNDALRLYHGTTVIDVIGIVGVDPLTNWPVDTGATNEYTLVRKPTIYAGDTVWLGSADTTYIAYAQNDVSHFGSHVCTPTLDPMITTVDSVLCNDSFGMNLYATDTTGVWSGTYVSNFAVGEGFFSSAAIAPGHYVATYGGNSCIIPDVVNIYVPVNPTAGFTYSVTTAMTFDFTNTSTNGDTYLWDFDGAGTSTLTNPSFTFLTNGTYTVCLEVTSDSGCVAVNCQNIIVTGLNELETSQALTIYPNPASDYVTLDMVKAGDVAIQNSLGETVLQRSNVNSKEAIYVGNLPAGVYTLVVDKRHAKRLLITGR